LIHDRAIRASAGSEFQALSVGEEARSRIGLSGQVHSTYEEALNIVFPKGIVSVVTRSKGRGPLNIVLATDHVDFSGIADGGTGVRFNGASLSIDGRLGVALKGAELYRSPQRFQRRPLRRDLIRRNVMKAQGLIISTGRMDGLGNLVHVATRVRQAGPVSNPFVAQALPPTRSFMQMFSEGNMAGAVGAAKDLIGLGIGLTPSGDDVLSGLLVALVLGSKNGISRSLIIGGLAERVAREAVGRTTLLSQNYLQMASQGKANEAVVQFVDELYTGPIGDVRRSLANLIGFGATSGTDIAAGVVLGVTLAMGDEEGAT
jgi:uncharacterized protein DUF2877